MKNFSCCRIRLLLCTNSLALIKSKDESSGWNSSLWRDVLKRNLCGDNNELKLLYFWYVFKQFWFLLIAKCFQPTEKQTTYFYLAYFSYYIIYCRRSHANEKLKTAQDPHSIQAFLNICINFIWRWPKYRNKCSNISLTSFFKH